MERQRYDRESKAQAVRLCEQGDVPIAQIARELGMNVKLLYRWCQQPQSQRATQNQQLLGQTQMVHQQSRQTYGSPKIQQALRQNSRRVAMNQTIGKTITM